MLRGVWLSDSPLDWADIGGTPQQNTVLRVTLAALQARLADYDVVEEGKGYREWLIPADVLNRMTTALEPLPAYELDAGHGWEGRLADELGDEDHDPQRWVETTVARMPYSRARVRLGTRIAASCRGPVYRSRQVSSSAKP